MGVVGIDDQDPDSDAIADEGENPLVEGAVFRLSVDGDFHVGPSIEGVRTLAEFRE
jgi:hypothetical protein